MNNSHKLFNEIEDLLKSSGRQWQILHGGKHLKILVEGRVAAIYPRDRRIPDKRAYLNTLRQIRQAIAIGGS